MTNKYTIAVLNMSGSGSSGSTQSYTISYADGAVPSTKTFPVDINDQKVKTFELASTEVVFKIMVNPSGEPNAEFILGVNGQGMSANVKHEENNTLAVVIV
ncbi:hypothetical protein JMJ77_0005126 [Colletotrichum scovillei]|uniref:Uncharacterized protein n=1 Tax=Colletotrichum scovillei TaxID=1209932 RepID=A0A9P7UH73_9PEZI|nr:hypothetical protein JMJ77_0005126 [Colletotrichum scovillei]KAG7076339.1 hypothetical protein JMJ76_0013604 [Colletotrichum scovillei]KAG7083485.1 hypothetical protein JMJ78_0008930 [Colletotrichum scovillei]